MNNLSQRFNSGINKNTNWFVADGELSQRDEKLSQKRRSMLGHRILGEIQLSQNACVMINRFEDKSDHPLDGNYARFGGLHIHTLDASPLPFIDIHLNTDLYEYIERAFIMPNPQIKFRLEPGDIFSFNNRRLLHGRTGFDPNSGHRHLQGYYMDRDEIIGRLNYLKK